MTKAEQIKQLMEDYGMSKAEALEELRASQAEAEADLRRAVADRWE